MYLIFEYMDSSLSSFIIEHTRAQKPLSGGQIKRIFHQIVSGLDFLHRNNIMHRDMKSGNILIDPATLKVKIADLGLSRHFNLPFSEYSPSISNQKKAQF